MHVTRADIHQSHGFEQQYRCFLCLLKLRTCWWWYCCEASLRIELSTSEPFNNHLPAAIAHNRECLLSFCYSGGSVGRTDYDSVSVWNKTARKNHQ